jgi:general secretion pathway protein A
MYETYFNLKERPFSISPDPRFIYLTTQHQEALAKCQYAISQRMGLSTIYGDIGAGKTSLSRRLWEQYAGDPHFNFAILVHPNYPSAFQFVNEVRREFGLIKPKRSLSDALNEFQKFLLDQHEHNKTTVLVIDEAQSLRSPIFEILRQMLNFETNTEKLLQIVLFGQNELIGKIEKAPELKDRITIFGALSSLSKEDTDGLIDFRWRVAGGKEHPFAPDALTAIFRYAKGSPRKVCKLCDNALIRTFSREGRGIDRKTIESVAEEIRLIESAGLAEGPPVEAQALLAHDALPGVIEASKQTL